MITKNRIKGFTLAEVLISLAIIGVISAITIPGLLQKTQDQELKTAWKKNYSDLSQATQKLALDQGGSLKGVLTSGNVITTFKPYFYSIKTCDGALGCWHDANQWWELDGDAKNMAVDSGMILNSGAMIFFGDIHQNCDYTDLGTPMGTPTCGYIYVDVNGFKKPNILGKDIFLAHIQANRLLPAGSAGDIWSGNVNNCKSTSGYACSASIILKDSIN